MSEPTHAHAAHDRYRWLFDGAAVHGIVLVGLDERIVEWNASTVRLTGIPADEAVGRDLDWLVRFLAAAAPPGDVLARARAGELVTSAGWATARGGDRWWCECAVSAALDGGEALHGFAITLHDATESRRREISHPESDSRFARALEHAPVSVFNQDRDLRYVWAPTALPGLGPGSGATAIGRTDDELLPPEAAQELTRIKRHVLEWDAVQRTEVELRLPGGDVVVDLTVQPLRGTDGALAGITCAAIDITDRRHAEDELRSSRRRLAEAERLARMGSWEWDIASDHIEWSDGLLEIYGLARETFDPDPAARDQRVHPDDLRRVRSAIAAALESGAELDIEYRIVRPDGRLRRLHGRAAVTVGNDGRAVRMAGTAQDVTEIRAAEEALEDTAAELGRRAAELHRVTRRSGAGTAPEVDRVISSRQLEILALIADGHGNAEIAARLFLSEGTVKWHVRQILRKLRVANRAEAAARYVQSRPAG